LVNNAYGLILRQSQPPASTWITAYSLRQYPTPPNSKVMASIRITVVEGLGCKAIRVRTQAELGPAIEQAEAWMARVPSAGGDRSDLDG
jgi:tartronate-semialdehyde synthase